MLCLFFGSLRLRPTAEAAAAPAESVAPVGPAETGASASAAATPAAPQFFGVV